MRKIVFCFFTLVCSIFSIYSEKPPVYISPNNDGIQDVLEVPLQIKEKRYVSEWTFTISNDKGEPVRVIGNKEKRPDRIGFKNFFKQLITPKSGVVIPSSVIWNGVMDNGEIAPDGTYYYSFSAADDNGNTASTSQLVVIVDNTPPSIVLTQPSSDAKIFGEGAKSTLVVKQDGSEEDLWIGTFSDSVGSVVKTYKWTESAPLKFEWPGTDDNGIPVKDGVYSYRITSKDRAGNVSNSTAITNIIYSAEKPATNIIITSSRYFSPNGDKKNDTVSFDVKIPVPDQQKTGNKLISWNVDIVDSDNNVIKSFNGTENPPTSIIYDGLTNNESIAKEGSYQARVVAKYLNGFETVPIYSPVFMLDTSAPTAKVTIKDTTFSPDGDGNLDILLINQQTIVDSGSPIEKWEGIITDSTGLVIKSFDFGAFPPENVTWNGVNSLNTLAKDGKYNYTLNATDAAGNAAKISAPLFALDTSKTELVLTVSASAFNPAKSAIKLTPIVNTNSQTGSSVTSYDLQIKNKTGDIVWSQKENKSLPVSFSWNGLSKSGNRCVDGEYTATLSTVSTNGAQAKTSTQVFVIDSVVPSIEVSLPYLVFSPDGDGNKDSVLMNVKSSNEDKWNGKVLNTKGTTVKTFSWKGTIPNFEWDGTDDSGNIVSDGMYKILFDTVDIAGNSATAEVLNVKVDNRETKAYITAEYDAMSPNNDGVLDIQKFMLRTSLSEGISNWSFDIVSAEGKLVRQWTHENQANLPAVINWDGTDSDGKVIEGVFTGNLTLTYEKGNKVSAISSAFISTVTPPQLSIKTAPKYFSPDNDGEDDDLFILLKGSSAVPLKNWSFTINDPENGKKFWSVSGKSTITERLIWDGRGNNGELVQSAMDYPYVFTVTDTLGMTNTIEGKISVDVLVIRVGDVLKMAVPSIIFRSDAADFMSENEVKGGLTDAQIANNQRVLKRIADILNKFKNYTVTIEGHANNISGTEDEETKDTTMYGKALEPLSQERAEFVKSYLKKNGVDGERLNAVGRGGRQPVVSRNDKDNWWKNRRVEFILNK